MLSFLCVHISYGQLIKTHRNVEQSKDLAFSVMFNSLWAELSLAAKSKDTTIILTDADKAFYYTFDIIIDTSLSDTMVIPVSKYAELSARYFEMKTNLKRPTFESYFPTPYLTYNLIKKWEKWYRRNKHKIDYYLLVQEINKLKDN
ncbi:hypothetical protein GXP67_04610 [Rhodocytophaga rosea]|uniref:Uncharacterized protein n=1 Tax=Rhodocytophaga rosea TaxID=2704465 RepID=A0A6C0GE19_9BACT|nr:hypothetical protein [Rhodocytophaga rosea]QHT66002.1 hypothetical protein GXP67_04610 [Rhodocytophaga rosea]